MSEPAYGPTGAGAVVLDVGGEIGALILHTPADLAGAEIEIGRRAQGLGRTHACVRARRGGHGTSYAAIYPGLPAGDYTIWAPDGHAAGTVTIAGGQITHHRLEPAAGGSAPAR
jgi:hypothetical protein